MINSRLNRQLKRLCIEQAKKAINEHKYTESAKWQAHYIKHTR